jgi:hypothetical protein
MHAAMTRRRLTTNKGITSTTRAVQAILAEEEVERKANMSNVVKLSHTSLVKAAA